MPVAVSPGGHYQIVDANGMCFTAGGFHKPVTVNTCDTYNKAQSWYWDTDYASFTDRKYSNSLEFKPEPLNVTQGDYSNEDYEMFVFAPFDPCNVTDCGPDSFCAQGICQTGPLYAYVSQKSDEVLSCPYSTIQIFSAIYGRTSPSIFNLNSQVFDANTGASFKILDMCKYLGLKTVVP